ncbi:cytochrome P450 [Crassisporium funariophilum]|nr:cytochrome P450 [Crassisporium funariophilum]
MIYRLVSPSNKGSIRQLGGFPIFTAWTFFTKRYDFLWYHFKQSADPFFKFKVLQHDVVAMRGEEARKAFFESKSLDFLEGYKILMGGAPLLKDVEVDHSHAEDVSWFNKQLVILLNKNRLGDALPNLLEDINRRMEGWGKSGRIDPFKQIYDLVFQMTVRMASCDELARDHKTIEDMQKLYWTLEKSSTPIALLLPWFPSPSKKRKDAATKELFVKLYGIVEMRRAAKVSTTDPIDILLEQGCGTEEIVGFILGVVFAGVINTGINSCWILVYLASHPEWKTKVKTEINNLLDKYTNTSSGEPLHKRLSTIPMSAWEDDVPILDSVIRETIRVVLTGTVLRRNLLEELTLHGRQIERGDFVAYSLGDVHLNPGIYSRPDEFDPARFGPGREEDKKEAFAFLGWGAGRHPCTGMKVAKLEIKVIVAFMLAGFEFDLVDKSGKPVTELPKPDRNDHHQVSNFVSILLTQPRILIILSRRGPLENHAT